MKALADMTPQEHANCVGMWCYIFERLDEPPVNEGIIAGYRETDNGRTLAIIDHPHPEVVSGGYGLNEIVPRFDLPRAWAEDGTPPAGGWEYDNISDKERMHVSLPDKNTTHRRWIGQWEEI